MIQIPPVYLLGPGKFDPGYEEKVYKQTAALLEAHEIPVVDPTYLDGPTLRTGAESVIYGQEITALNARINMITSGVAAIIPLQGAFDYYHSMAQLFAARAVGVTIIDIRNGLFEEEAPRKFWEPILFEDFLETLDDLR